MTALMKIPGTAAAAAVNGTEGQISAETTAAICKEKKPPQIRLLAYAYVRKYTSPSGWLSMRECVRTHFSRTAVCSSTTNWQLRRDKSLASYLATKEV